MIEFPYAERTRDRPGNDFQVDVGGNYYNCRRPFLAQPNGLDHSLGRHHCCDIVSCGRDSDLSADQTKKEVGSGKILVK
jgi:hypothetical protein